MNVLQTLIDRSWARGGVMVALCLCLLTLVAAPVVADDAAFVERVKRDTRWLSDYGTRQVGTEAHRRLQDDLLARVKEIPGAAVWTDEYPVVVPVHEETFLEIEGGSLAGRHDMFPLWPDVARLNNTPAGGIRGELIYVGDGSYKNLPAHGLRGQIAVMEMSAYEDYRRVFNYGAAAVILLESDKAGKPVPSKQSLYKPRYYVPAGPLADALRAGKARRAKIVSRSDWKKVTARNIYVGIKPEASADEMPWAVVAPYDSMSRVMGVAPGADAAIDCATVLNVLEDAAKQPPRALLFGFVDAYHLNQMGMRRMSAMLTITPSGLLRSDYREIEQEKLDEYLAAQKELERVGSFEKGLKVLYDQSKADRIRSIFKDVTGATLLRLREIEGELRLVESRQEALKVEANRPIEEQTTLPRLRMILRSALLTLDEAANWLLRKHKPELTADQIKELESAQAFASTAMENIDFTVGGSSSDGPSETEVRQSLVELITESSAVAEKVLEIVESPLKMRNSVQKAALIEGGEPLSEEEMVVARIAWEKMAERVNGQVEVQRARLTYFDPMDQVRSRIADHFQLAGEKLERRAAAMVAGIDLSDCGILVGPGDECHYNRIKPSDKDLMRPLKWAVKRGELWPEGSPHRRVVNIGAIEGRVGGAGFLGTRALITSVGQSFLLPGITWVTDDAPRQRVDSPLDRYDQLRWDRVGPQLAPTRRFLDWLWTEAEYKPDVELASQNRAAWRHGMGQVVDASAGETIPRVPRPGFLSTLVGGAADRDSIRRHDFTWTKTDGEFRIPLMCAEVYGLQKDFELHAFRLSPLGALVEALTTKKSMVAARLATSFSLNRSPGDQLPRALTFRCTELNGPSFFDARFLEALSEASLIDVAEGGPPRQGFFNMDAETGQMWGLVERGMRWQMVVRAGAAGVRMALLNVDPDAREKGLSLKAAFKRGFPVDEPLPSIATHISAQDLFHLNGWRLSDFRESGISSDKIDEIRDGTKEALDAADEAIAEKNGAALERSSVQAMASEIRAYRAVKTTGQDIVRGAIFLMLMLVPFAVAMERLLFAYAEITRRIVAAMAIFAAMTLLLWSFHPAFQISAQPLVIVMAFAILAMSVAVIALVLARFKAAVREFQSSLAEGSAAQMGRSGLLGSAVFLGIANMRKRKVRTALTGATIVLVTFALLCFSSTSSYIDKKDFRLEGVSSDNASVLIRRPTFGPINWMAGDAISNLLGDHEVTIGQRAWMAPDLGETDYRIWLLNSATGTQAPVRGALGLPPNEDRLTGVDRVLTDWSTFAEQGGCYLSDETAERLGVSVGDPVVFRGYEMTLRGIFDPIDLEDKVELLDGQRILPYDYSRQEKDWIDRDSQSAMEQEMQSAGGMQPSGDDNEKFLPAREVIILPTEVARELGADLRSVAVPCDDPEQSARVAHSLMETIVYPSYYTNDEGGVNVVVATPLIAVPPKSLAVPLVIAALIIFTTMLNSVSERKSEIYVYASLGLAPLHIGALFVAESLTYGLMGAVFGYIAGQGTATAVTSFGWMPGITLNYSGTAVIKTMVMVQAVAGAAAIVPAIVAGKIASPSSDAGWQVPEPVDGEIHDILPFTVTPPAAPGLLAFIQEYLEAHRDGVLGKFDVDNVHLLPAEGEDHIGGLSATVWLAPFDMGVRQQIWLTIEPPEDGICAIAVRIKHETGTPKVWWRLNKTFFYHLRRQLLGWRKVSAERIQEYVEKMEAEEIEELKGDE